MSSIPYSARKNATNCTWGKLNSPSINVWHTQHRRATSSGQDSAVNLHLKESGHSCEGVSHPLRGRRLLVWKGCQGSHPCWGKKKTLTLNRAGGLRLFLSPTYTAVLHSLGQNSKHSHRLTRPDDSPTEKGERSQQKLDQRPCQRLSGDHPGH